MSAEHYITVSDEAQQIAAWLGQWAETKGGTVKVMANLAHLWEELYGMDEKPRLLVCYTGEQARGGFSYANRLMRVDRQWTVVVTRGHGWANLMTDAGSASEGSVDPFYDVVEVVRDLIRVMDSISAEWPVDYKATRPMPNAHPARSANVFMDAMAIEFSTANDIPWVFQSEDGATRSATSST